MTGLLLEEWPRLVAMAAAVLASAVFAGAETAFFSLGRGDLRELGEKSDRVSRLICWLAARPRFLLVVTLLGNLAANVIFFSVAVTLSKQASAAGHPGGAFGLNAAAVAVVIFGGEFLPKGRALANPVRAARRTVYPLVGLSLFLWPAGMLLYQGVRLGSRLVGGGAGREPFVTSGEFRAFVRMSGAAAGMDADEREMLQEVIEFGDIRVREVMVPRVDMVAVDLAAGREGILEAARARRVSKVVVCRGSPDRVAGFVAVKDLLYDPEAEVESLVREILAVPETKTVMSLLEEFRRSGAPLALVVDEYGGTAGIVTPEDLVEEIVGEIADEYDLEEGRWRWMGPGVVLLPGSATLREWEERIGTPLPEGRYETVGGYVQAALDRIPAKGDVVRVDGVRISVLRVRRGRVLSVLAERSGEEPGAAGGGGKEAPA